VLDLLHATNHHARAQSTRRQPTALPSTHRKRLLLLLRAAAPNAAAAACAGTLTPAVGIGCRSLSCSSETAPATTTRASAATANAGGVGIAALCHAFELTTPFDEFGEFSVGAFAFGVFGFQVALHLSEFGGEALDDTGVAGIGQAKRRGHVVMTVCVKERFHRSLQACVE
jgi:hypothetical protein